MPDRPFSEYAARNAAPILEILQREFRNSTRVLEIGSGTGQHAVTFAAALDHLQWQTSDLDENHAGIRAWIESANLDNVVAPLSMDVREASMKAQPTTLCFRRTRHTSWVSMRLRGCSPWLAGHCRIEAYSACTGLFSEMVLSIPGATRTLMQACGQRDPVMGIRAIETLDEFAASAGLRRVRCYCGAVK